MGGIASSGIAYFFPAAKVYISKGGEVIKIVGKILNIHLWKTFTNEIKRYGNKIFLIKILKYRVQISYINYINKTEFLDNVVVFIKNINIFVN